MAERKNNPAESIRTSCNQGEETWPIEKISPLPRDCVAIPFMVRQAHHERMVTLRNSKTQPFVPSLNCYVDVKSRTHESSYSYDSFTS